MAIRPRAPVVELDSMTHQHLRQPLSRSHQIQAQCLPGANEIAQRLFFGARDADRVQLAGEQQPDEMLSVAALVLDLVAGRARDLRRRRDHTFDPALRELARERVPSRTRLVGGPDRSRQSGAQGRRTAFSPLSTNIPSSPVSASRTAATILVACTSRPTRDLALAMAGSSYAVVDAARGATRTAQTP